MSSVAHETPSPPAARPPECLEVPIHALRLAGDDEAMGRGHARLACALGGADRPARLLDHYQGYLRRRIEEGLGGPRWLRAAAWEGLNRFFHDALAAGRPPALREETRGFAAEAGLAARDVERGVAMPDVLLNLIRLGHLARDSRLVSTAELLQSLACTHVGVRGAASVDGALYIGRNFDFPGAGIYDEHPAVIFYRPAKGLRYCSVASLGLLPAGVTAMNEAGLTLGVNMKHTRDACLRATPLLDITRTICREAASIDEAAAVAARFRFAGGYGLILGEGETGRAAVLEVSAARQVLREVAGDTFAHTNHYRAKAQQAEELDVGAAVIANSVGRLERAEALLRDRRGPLGPRDLAAILGDHLDPFIGRTRGFGVTIAVPDCLASVVFDPKRRRLWVASGRAPAHHGRYLPFSLDREGPDPDSEPLPASPFVEDRRYPAYLRYVEAGRSYEARDIEAAAQALSDAEAGDPDEPIYALMHGVVELSRGRPREALASLDRAAAQPDLAHRLAASRLWRARALDLLGERGEAARGYESALALRGPVGRDLRTAASRGLRRPYAAGDARRVELALAIGDAIFY